MSLWKFIITADAQEDLKKLDKEVRQRILDKLKWFTENFDYVTPFPLSEPYKGFFKLRVGDWRVIYQVEHAEKLVSVHIIDRRDKIYKR